MSNYEIYAQSIDAATLAVVTITADANYPLTNMQDRREATIFKAGNANTSGYINIDLAATRACDYILLGNHNYTVTSVGIKLASDDNDDGNYSAVTYSVGAAGSYEDYTSGDADRWKEAFTSKTKRYWRLYLEAMGGGTYQEIGTIFMGTLWNWAHEPELRKPDDSGYIVNLTEAAGGDRFSQIAGTTVRRNWGIPVEWNAAAEVVKMETFRDAIFMDSRNGLSRYPFYFTDDGGTTFYFARYRGKLHLEQQAYQQWKTNHVFEEEL